MTAPLGWKLEAAGRAAFRRITYEIAYPLYGAQIMLVEEGSAPGENQIRPLREDRAPRRDS